MDDSDTVIVMETLLDIRRAVYDIHSVVVPPDEDEDDEDAKEEEEEP